MFIGASPISLGRGNPWPVAAIGADFVFVFRFLHFLRCAAGVDQLLHHAIFDELHSLAAHAFAIEMASPTATDARRHRQILMFSPNSFCADTIVEKRPLIEYRQAAEIPEHESDHVEHGRWFEDYRVLSRQESRGAG